MRLPTYHKRDRQELRERRAVSRNVGRVMIALFPAFLVGIFIFGYSVIALTVVCIFACVVFEALFNVIVGRKQTVGDLSAALTGVLLSFCLPANLPHWIAIIGCFFAIIVVKQLFGGIGSNIANPAISAQIFLIISFSEEMANWPIPNVVSNPDIVTGATPLALAAEQRIAELPSYMEMFLGFTGGSMGAVSAIVLIIGGLFLIWKRVISPIIPLAFIGTVYIIALLVPGEDPVFHILAGGVMLGAFFMATDSVTSPESAWGQLIFGIGCGVITMAIRLYGLYPDGVAFAILFMNLLVPYLDKVYIGKRKEAETDAQ